LNNFLENIDVLVAGLTGTMLDAYIKGVPSVYVVDEDKAWSGNDNYDFIKIEFVSHVEI